MSTEVQTRQQPARLSTKQRAGAWLANNGAFVGLFAVCLAMFIATPNFLTTRNLLNVGVQAAVVAILAFGMTFVIITGGIDLSVGSVIAVSSVAGVMLSNAGWNAFAVIVAMIGIGMLFGRGK